MTAVAIAPSTESENNAFFLVRATGLTATSLNNPNIRIIEFILSFRKSSGLLESFLKKDFHYES
jgi:hypothetical protein